jgi:hypothetical protein
MAKGLKFDYSVMTYLQSIFIIVLLLTVFGCEKESDNPETEKSKLLTNGVWKIVQVGIDSNMDNQLSQNEMDTLLACESGNIYDFQPSGKLVIDDIGVQCEPTSIIGYSWYLRENDSFLEIRSHGGAFTAIVMHKILELNNDKMLLTGETIPQVIFVYTR